MAIVFERPVFVVAPPRSGTTLLFEILAQAPALWTIGGESHVVIESIPKLQPAARGWDSNRLTADDADPETVRRLVDGFVSLLRDRDGKRPSAAMTLRFLEKTPRNCLRISFLDAAFADARFIYLFRQPVETVSSMLDAWRSKRFITYPCLPGWAGPWSLLLVPRWRALAGKDVAEIAARQWDAATSCLLDDLEAVPANRWCVADYERLLREPQAEVERLCRWIGVEWDRKLPLPLPPSRSILTPPEPEKWRRNGEEIDRVMPLIRATAARSLEVREAR
jgi:hypothetical protein